MNRFQGAPAAILGATQEIVLTDVVIAPELYIQVVTDCAGLQLAAPALRIVDRLRGRAVFSPITPAAARAIAGNLLQYADQQMDGGGQNGSATVHE